MLSIECTTAERLRAQELMEFVRREYLAMSSASRQIFAIEVGRLTKQEIAELKLKANESK